jgi:hypothetical protein
MDRGKVGFIQLIISSLFKAFLLGIRNFIVGITVKIASDEASLRKEKTYINKINLALVQVLPFPRSCYGNGANIPYADFGRFLSKNGRITGLDSSRNLSNLQRPTCPFAKTIWSY